MWPSSCAIERTRVMPWSEPVRSFRCSRENSAMRSGSSRYERLRERNTRQCPGQFIGFTPSSSPSSEPGNRKKSPAKFS